MAEEASTTNTRPMTPDERTAVLAVGETAGKIVYEALLCGRSDMAGTSQSCLIRARNLWRDLGDELDKAIALLGRRGK